MKKGINPNLKKIAKQKLSLSEYLSGILNGDRYVLGQALTLIESTQYDMRQLGDQILSHIETKDRTIRIGITGSPGAGKSTLIEALGMHYISLGKKVAVLAIDPSSNRSLGSILGDKTRMQTLSVHPSAFVRPTPSSNLLGGLAKTTKESIALCEAAGYDIIFVESVGVGQSETSLAEIVDLLLLVILPGGGDEVQGIKRGIVEHADIIVINKDDGEQTLLAAQSKKDFKASIGLFHHELKGWKVSVLSCSALNNKGISTIQKEVDRYVSHSINADFFFNKRRRQDHDWMTSQVKNAIIEKMNDIFDTNVLIDKASLDIEKDEKSIFSVLHDVLSIVEQKHHTLKSINK